MSVDIKLKHSSQAGKVPVVGNLTAGELALNTADEKVYMLNSSNAVVQVAGKGGGDGEYVKVAGDDMTGNLTLGTDKITLNAGDGSASFANDAVNITKDGVIETKASFEFSSTIYTVTPGVGFRSNSANSLATYTAGVLRNYIDADGTTNVVIDGRSADAEGFKTIGTLSATSNAYVGYWSQPSAPTGASADNSINFVTHFLASPANSFVDKFDAGTSRHAGYTAGQGISGADLNAGFYAELESGNPNSYNFYAAGTAPNYFAGSATFAGDVAIGDSATFLGNLGDAIAQLPPTITEQFANIISSLPTAQPFAGDPTTLPADIPTPLKDALVRVTTAGKINLNSDGSATFNGPIQSGTISIGGDPTIGANNGSRMYASGGVLTSGTGILFYGYKTGEDTLKVEIDASGSATFAGTVKSEDSGNSNKWSALNNGYIVIQDPDANSGSIFLRCRTTSNDTLIEMYGDGSATFKGGVEQGNWDAGLGSELANGYLFTRHDGGGGGNSAFAAFAGGDQDANIVAKISYDGSAAFKGDTIVGDTDGGAITNASGVYLGKEGYVSLFKSNTESSRFFACRNFGDTDNVFTVENDGSASFAGDITAPNVTFNLEPDNKDNYTTTTEEYEETIQVPVETGVATADLVNGAPEQQYTEQTVTKTREIKTYTGPTMDVKQTLLDITGALESLKTAAASATTIAELRTAIETSLANI